MLRHVKRPDPFQSPCEMDDSVSEDLFWTRFPGEPVLLGVFTASEAEELGAFRDDAAAIPDLGQVPCGRPSAP